MNNIMVDLEAMDSKRSAILVSIGAVYFDIPTQTLGEQFYVEISKAGIDDQYNKGRTFSFDTFNWWMAQSASARNVFLKNEHEKQGIVEALHLFSRFVNETYEGSLKTCIWGNGVDYDNVVLRDTYETYGIHAPWHYAGNRCYRTVKNLFGNRAKLNREGTHHNGLADAITQANHLMAMMKGVVK